MHYNGYDTYPNTASMTGATSVGASSPTSNLSPTNRRSHGTSNPSSAEGMSVTPQVLPRHWLHTCTDDLLSHVVKLEEKEHLKP
jgi:hypothetical protein